MGNSTEGKMHSLMEAIQTSYKEMLMGISPEVDSWLFMKSPIPVVAILITYLYVVLKLGPKWMENRKAFDLKWLIVAYNGYQVIFAIWLCAQAFLVENVTQHMFNFACEAAPQKEQSFLSALHRGAWWYFFSKVVDLLDTIFFVLRKKQNQVSFLHVYHHTNVCFFSWVYLKYIPGEQGIVIGFLNSLVHSFMYFYYMLAAMGPQYRKYLWWKKYITWMQLIQFSIMLIYLSLLVIFNCQFSRGLTAFFMANVMIFLYLFSNFYAKTYAKNASSKTVKLPSASTSDTFSNHNSNSKLDNNNNSNSNKIFGKELYGKNHVEGLECELPILRLKHE